MEWLNANTNFQLPTVEDGGADATVDMQTGEVSGPDDTAAPVEFGVQLGEPSKKTHRRKTEPKQGDEFSDGFGDDTVHAGTPTTATTTDAPTAQWRRFHVRTRHGRRQ